MRDKYLFLINGKNNNYKTRIKSPTFSDHEELWKEIHEVIYALGIIILANKDEFADFEIKILADVYKYSDIAHNYKLDLDRRKEASKLAEEYIQDNLERFAIKLGLSREELLDKIELEIKKAYGLETVGKQHSIEVNTVERELSFAPEKKEEVTFPIDVNKERTNMQPIEPTTSLQPQVVNQLPIYRYSETPRSRVRTGRRIEEESRIKFSISTCLQKAKVNLTAFPGHFENLQLPGYVKEIRYTKEPILKEQRTKDLKEHIKKLEDYYYKIAYLYGDYYNLIVSIQNGEEIVTLEEFKEIFALVTIVEKMTIVLNAAAGSLTHINDANYRSAMDIPIKEYKRRRYLLSQLISEYNNQLDESKNAQDSNKKRL